MPPWNPILGNLITLAKLRKYGPADTRQAEAFALLSTQIPGLEDGFYIDAWPFSIPLLAVTSPKLAIQACQNHDLPKPHALQPFINPMAGGSDNLFVSNGSRWRQMRDRFNHGFSLTAALGHMSCVLEEAEVFVQMLKAHARVGDTFSLDQLTCRYAMDIIGNIALNTRFRYQQENNPIATAMRDIIELECGIETTNIVKRWSPRRLYIQWKSGRTLNNLIGIELDKCYRKWKEDKITSISSRPKSIMDIVIAEYMKTRPQEDQHLDPEFRAWAVIQIRLFLFVGHDSEASSIIYCLYLLSKHPEMLARVREEHSKVFGAGAASALEVLKRRPEMVNQLPYTNAVIKETLRLFPPANGMRGGLPGVSLRDEDGTLFPTEGCGIWIVHAAVHRNPSSWVQPHSFIPERWLVEEGHPLYPPTGGWRPFEHGPRSCIGQSMSLMGIRATLAVVVRQFDFHDQYAEYDRLDPSTGINEMFGERAYMIQKGAGHPAHGFPCKVTLRDSLEEAA
ncbi:hypothetical protein N7456_002692 [Penicillium angulare]|uniref:Cytochrome P450 n=1 Tax=Penicillium angulare TaxID=116970 RepID=A0A9W9G8R5_9EURO|nr:hypothetical protein N7456_002692 [Penicillium angulare]